MAKTALELSPEEWKKYSLPKRVVPPELQAHWDKAWKLIPELAELLRKDFGAKRIRVFGSAVKIDYFSVESDIDLAAWDIPVDKYFKAILAVDEYNPDFRVDLVDPSFCSERLLKRIEEQGIDV
ncbi:MAG: nucleotidyltransferase domain-containing protein [Cyanobacteria bacterium P01_G01_bin.38]